MKKIIALALALIMVLSMGTVAFAADALPAAVGGVITLTEDVTLADTHTFNESVTLDLNGYAITGASGKWVLKVDGNSTLTLTDSSDDASGTIEGEKGISVVQGSELIMNGGNINVTGAAGAGIQIYGSTATMNGGSVTAAYGAILIYSNNDVRGTFEMTGGKLDSAAPAIYANGSEAWDNCDVTISGGEITGNDIAIYWPAAGKLTISGGTITGKTAVYVKSGTVEISGGSLIATGAKKDYEYVGSGAVTTGDALVIENVGGASGYETVSASITGGTFESENGNAVASYAATSVNAAAEPVEEFISGGSFSDDVTEFLADGVVLNENGTVIDIVNPGNTIVVDDDIDRTVYKVKGYDFTTGTEGYQGASYIDEIKIDKNNDLIIVLKDNYKLATDKNIKGVIYLVNKSDKNDTMEIPVEYNVKNIVVETAGEKKAKDAIEIPEGENQVILMDEDGGYVSFQEELLKGVVKMEKEEKTFLNIWYGNENDTTEDIIDAIEAELGEEYVDEAIIEYYTFETRAFKNDVDFSYEAYEDDPHFFYLWNDGKLTKIDAKYNDDEEVEAWVWTATAEGTIIVTDVEIVLADETTKNPDTGANDVVGVAAALAVVSLVAAGAISLKK